MANYSNEDGVWRTIGGRRVFIKNGQSLEEAMKESGKFKSNKTKKDIANMNPEEFMKEAELEKKVLIEKEKFKKGQKPEIDKKENRLYGENLKNYKKANSEWKELQSKMEKDYDEFGTTNWKDEKRLNELSKERDIAQSQISSKDVKNANDRFLEKAKALNDKDKGKINEEEYFKKLNEIDDIDNEEAKKQVKENLDKLGVERPDFLKEKNEQFEVSDLKKKAMETLPKEDIDTHEGDLYIKKTKESEALLKNMKNADSGMLSTFKDQQTGETWYDVPFANMEDDYKVKSGNPIESMANDRVKEKQNSLQNTKSMLDYMEKNKIDKLPDGTTKDELEFKNWERQNYIDTANGNFENLKKNTMSEAEKEKYMKDNNLTTFTSRDEYNYLKNKEKATNEAINNKLREKASKKDKFKEDLPKHVPIKEQGTSNRKEVSENIQAHILEYYGPDYTGDDSVSASEAFVRQMDAMGEPNMWKAGQRIAEGGSYLIYNGDMADFLDELKINPKGKKFSEDKSFDMYTSLIGRESAKLYDRIKRNSYNKYMKEHPLSRMTFEEFKKEK